MTAENAIPGMAQSVATPVSPAEIKLIGCLTTALGCARLALTALNRKDDAELKEAVGSLSVAAEDVLESWAKNVDLTDKE